MAHFQRWYLAGTVHYIEQQLEHHRTRTFQEVYLAFLKKHGAHFDEKYLWD
jgi:putative transposase